MADDLHKTPFAYLAFAFDFAKCTFEDALDEAGVEFDSIGWDHYDCSVEIYKVGNGVRLTEAQPRIIFDAGFRVASVNHQDGWETHSNGRGDAFALARGWRRRYVSDETVATTNVIAGPPNPGYFEISYWPEGWGDQQTDKHGWLKSGYMRVVPDPLDPTP